MGWSEKYKKSINCDNPKGFSQRAHCQGRKKRVNEDLRNWFNPSHPEGGWKRYNTKGEAVGSCARKEGEPKPKCLSNEKAAKLRSQGGAKAIANAVKRKRKADPVANRKGKGGKPKMVSNNIEEQSEMIRYCPKCQKNETQSECKYGPSFWAMYSSPAMLTTNQMKFDIAQVHPTNEEHSKDHEYSMARSELSTIINAAKRLQKKMKGEGNIEAWVQSKITKAADYIDTAADYLDSGEHKVDEACWDGYEQRGMKKKGKKMVPNCVKEENKPTNPKLWAKWKAKAKAKFDVYPSAYANGWAAKGYKSEGGGWKSVSEGISEDLEQLDELSGALIRAAARHVLKNKALQKTVSKSLSKGAKVAVGKPAPAKLKFKTLYHGTTKKASDAITKGGWKTDVGVTAQRRGVGVYATPEKRTAMQFATDKAKMQGGKPDLRQFRMRKDVYNDVMKRQAADPKDWVHKSGVPQVTMKPEYANKIDVTGKVKPTLDFSGSNFTGDMGRELKKHVRAGLKRKPNVDQLKGDLKKGQEASKLYRTKGGNPEAARNPVSFDIGSGHKSAMKNTKIYNKGKRTDNPHEKEIFLKRTGPQLPISNGYEPEGDLLEHSNWREELGLNEDWQSVNRKDKTDGLSQKAVDAYRRENPGSKLQTAVTEKKPTGKRAQRRKNFCSRMGGMKKRLTSAKTARDPDSRINKALRRWRCN